MRDDRLKEIAAQSLNLAKEMIEDYKRMIRDLYILQEVLTQDKTDDALQIVNELIEVLTNGNEQGCEEESSVGSASPEGDEVPSEVSDEN